MSGALVVIPDGIRTRLKDYQNYFGVGIRLANAVGVYPTYFSKMIRGEQTMINKDMLARLEKTLKTFDPGERTGISLNRRPRAKRTPATRAAARATPEAVAVEVAKPVRAVVRKKKRKYTKRVAQLAPVQVLHTNGNGQDQEREVVLMGILDGMAIQAEVMRRTVTEYINRLPGVDHGIAR